jgi:hypothetical protein
MVSGSLQQVGLDEKELLGLGRRKKRKKTTRMP